MTAQSVMPELAAMLGLDVASLAFVRASQNWVYEVRNVQAPPHILRLTALSHRSGQEVECELAWLRQLYECGVPVCPPVLRAGECQMIVPVELGGEAFHTVFFQKATGRPVAREGLSPRLYECHGRALGRLHAAARRGTPEVLSGRRPWPKERYFTTDIGLYLPARVRNPVREQFQRLLMQVSKQADTPENNGPLHFDLGYSNVFATENGLELIDFDNAARGPFVADIAAALYGSLFTGLRCDFPGDRSCFEPPKSGQILEEMWEPFRQGYRQESVWPDEWNPWLGPWVQILYLRSVVHAFRLRHPITQPQVRGALMADVSLILAGEMPLKFDFVRGKAL